MIDDSLLIRRSSSLKECLKRLDSSARGILFVTDEDGTLNGTITDGDVRRAMLNGAGLEVSIEGVFNSAPTVLSQEEYSEEVAQDLLRRFGFKMIPVLDRAGRIVDAAVPESGLARVSISKKPSGNLDIPVVIMAGGKGTRLAPFTNVLPKPLIPIGEKTILEHIIDEFKGSGIRKFIFTLNYRAEMIKAYLDGIDRDYTAEYIVEPSFLGTAGSLTLAKTSIRDRCIVSNCDIIVRADYSDVVKYHDERGSWLTVVSSVQHIKVPYGVVRYGEGGRIQSIEEKPEFSMTVNTGVYVLDHRCLEFVPPRRQFHMTELIGRLLAEGLPVHSYPVSERDYIDIGQWQEYRKAVDRMRDLS